MPLQPLSLADQPKPPPPAQFSTRRKILFVLIALPMSLGVAAMLGEAIVRAGAPQNLSGTWREATPRGYMRNKAGGTARHQLGQRVVHYRFNEYHLRGGPLQMAQEKRLLALGDSFTFGWLLNEPDTYLAKLHDYAEASFGKGKIEILNGAAGGWGTADYTAFLEEIGPILKPNVVLVFLGVDDTRRAAASRLYRLTDPSANMTVEPVQSTAGASRLKKLVNLIPGYSFLLERSHLLQLARRASVRGQTGAGFSRPSDRSADTGTTLPVVAPNYPAILKEKGLFLRLQAWCKDHQAKLLVVTNWPVEQRFTPVEANDLNIAFRNQAEEFFRQQGIEFFDPGPQLREQIGSNLDQYRIPNDGHPTEAGADLIANAVWPWLEPRLRD